MFGAMPGRSFFAKQDLPERDNDTGYPVGVDVGNHGDAVEERSPERKLPVEANRHEEIDLRDPEYGDNYQR